MSTNRQDQQREAALDYDVDAAAVMLAELLSCDPAKRLDTLAVVVRVFVDVIQP